MPASTWNSLILKPATSIKGANPRISFTKVLTFSEPASLISLKKETESLSLPVTEATASPKAAGFDVFLTHTGFFVMIQFEKDGFAGGRNTMFFLICSHRSPDTVLKKRKEYGELFHLLILIFITASAMLLKTG